MSNKPALLITINSLRSGGAERVVSQLLWYLKEEFEIHLALYSHIIEYDIPPGVIIYDMDQSEEEGAAKMLFKLPGLAKKLSAYAKKNNVKYSVAFLNRPCYINALMRRFYGFKGRIVMCERTYQTSMLSTKSSLTRLMTRILIPPSYNTADLVLANAEAMKEDLIRTMHVRKPIEVIYNPIDLPQIKIKMEEPVSIQKEKDIFYFIGVGNFRKEKNFPLLTEAFNLLKGLACKLILVGDGPDKEQMVEMLRSAGTESQVIFVGKDRNPFRWMKMADAFVLSSDVEGFPNVLLEALACGKPSVATDCLCGPREMLAPGTGEPDSLKEVFKEYPYGLLTPVGNAKVLSEAMKQLMTDESMRSRLAEKGKMRAMEFDLPLMAKQYADAFSGRGSYQHK